MQTSQRGSVLLTIIGGIVILALLGMVAVSLMTGSVMTGLDAKETVQASYLAESGKEIVRVQTAQQSGGEMMSIARQLEESSRQHNGKGIEIDGKGFVKLTLYPSWFRWYEDKLHLTDSGWYGGVPNGKREMLVLNQNGAMRYAYENGFGSETPGSTAADVYLIGRVQGENGSITYDTTKRTLTVKTTADDLKWFPEYGGLIGLVRQQGKDSQLPTSTQVSKLRFTYDSKKTDGDVHTFTNFIPLSEGTISEDTFKDKDIVLGQYFRVVSEAQTANGARAALVWHTNGRSSLRFAGSGGSEEGGNATENIIGGNLSSEEDLKELFGQHLTEHNLNKGYTFTKYGPDLTALSVQGFQPSMPNHFLLKTTRKTSTDYWFAGITDKTIPIDSFQKEHGVMIQISTMIHPPGSSKKPHFFGGSFSGPICFKGNRRSLRMASPGWAWESFMAPLKSRTRRKKAITRLTTVLSTLPSFPALNGFPKTPTTRKSLTALFASPRQIGSNTAVSLYRGFHLPDAK